MTRCSTRGLLATLDARGPVEATTLATALEVHPMTVTKQCYELQCSGYVRQISGDVYTITEDGREHLAALSE